jgi:hypothetical protein
VGQTAGKVQRGRAGERAARLERARRRRLEMDKDREAREARVDAAVADVYQAQEDRQQAAQAIELAEQRIGEAINRILGEGVAVAQAAELTELSVPQVQRLRGVAAGASAELTTSAGPGAPPATRPPTTTGNPVSGELGRALPVVQAGGRAAS